MGWDLVYALRVNPGDKESTARHERDARCAAGKCTSYIEILGLGFWRQALAVDTLPIGCCVRPESAPASETGGYPANDAPNRRAPSPHPTPTPPNPTRTPPSPPPPPTLTPPPPPPSSPPPTPTPTP